MGYRIKKLPYKNRDWKVQYQSRVGVRKDRDIPVSEYLTLGFRVNMSPDEAKNRCQQLNAQEGLKRVEEKRNAVAHRLAEESLVVAAHLPKPLLERFEGLYIAGKLASHWRCVTRVLVALKLPPEDWAFHKDLVYKHFGTLGYSYSYIQKVILLMNKWGRFTAREQGKFFEDLPFPRHRDKERLLDLYGESNASLPISPKELESRRSGLTELAYNWLYLSIWLGLRPSEVDSLLKEPSSTTWALESAVIWVYQSKLTGIARVLRLKPIPLIYPEQRYCIEIINARKFKRPLCKTIQKYFGEKRTCYAGRKGFTDLMLEKGHSLEAVSQWMGHQSIERTWKVYKDKKKVLL